jgi:solute:Na+ symporter, SSS family
MLARKLFAAFLLLALTRLGAPAADVLKWTEIESLPNELGVAGPFAGVHNDALIVAGGANFKRPIWETDKTWYDEIHVLEKSGDTYQWHLAGKLPRKTGYGAAVSTPNGVICLGGNDGMNTFADAFVLTWDATAKKVTQKAFPSLPKPCAYGQAVLLGNTLYVAGGQSGNPLDTAMKNFWSIDLAVADPKWRELEPWPGPNRAFNLIAAQHNGYNDCVYVMSGRRQEGEEVQFLKDVWEFNPASGQWRARAEMPHCRMAGTAIKFGQSHVFVLGGADGSLWADAPGLGDKHPGFSKEAWMYHTITDTWVSAGAMPANHVTTVPVNWNGRLIVPSGEVRPRVRSAKIWSIEVTGGKKNFGAVNYVVLFAYLALMVGIGAYFSKKNKNTDDFFRGGKRVVWWAAGCSIFATMLSSLTFTGLPSKSFAQDWVYAVGNFMIPLVAFVAVYVALPFYRRIDATSAYEYLEKRFNRPVRLFGSASFTLFHIFRMAIVMSLTAMALAVATPLTPTESVLLMGVLSIIYSAMGGIEAVIWTDTAQTVVLMGGGLIAIGMLITGVDGGFSGFTSLSVEAGKFDMAHFNWDITSSQIALWVIILGSIGQNTSSYTADQAVVQRYMTTADQKLAARAIWTNAILSIIATLLFFGMGTALWAYYQSNPGNLDPTITTDQIFPLFIATQMPVGLAGLIIAGVFAAAQSTVSTSMNSTATIVVTDFMRPFNACKDEQGYLKAARFMTVLFGILGTGFALIFINPEIKSLFDEFLKIIGLFMGVLGGLFVLGVATTRANGTGAMIGAVVGAATMFYLWKETKVTGYIYTTAGITSCFVVGYLTSMVAGSNSKDLTGLTIHSASPAEK